MPVAVMNPNMPQQEDPLDKLAKALQVAQSGFKIYTDMKTLDDVRAKKAKEDQLTDLQIKDLQTKTKSAENEQAGILTGNQYASAMKDFVSAKQGEKGAFMLQRMGPDGKPIVEWVKKGPKEFAPRDPVAQALAEERLQAMKDKRTQGTKRDVEFGKRFKNINTQLDELDKLVDSRGTYEMFGDHEQKLKQAIDSVSIDSAKLFDPESVARESEVAAFRNMLFEPGTLKMSNSTARGALENYKKIIRSRAENEGLAHLIDQGSATMQAGGQSQVPTDVQQAAKAILEKRRKDARR